VILLTLSIGNLEEILKNGENSHIEFKETNVRPESIAKELVAFLNFEGGTLFIGISDNGEILGVNEKNFEEWTMNICRNSIFPPIIPSYEELIIDDKKVIKIHVNKGSNKPYYVSTNNKYYIRVGSTSREPSQQELISLLQDYNALHFELAPMFNSSIKDISKIRLEDYFNKRGIEIDEFSNEELENLLFNTEIMVESNSQKCVSLVGMLFFLRSQAYG
jgi:ATP-dependent DNA helicase RecG